MGFCAAPESLTLKNLNSSSMNLNGIQAVIKRLFLSKKKESGVALPTWKPGGLLNQLRFQYTWRIDAQMDTWRDSVDEARHWERPNRRNLYALYRAIEVDDQVSPQLRVAKAAMGCEPFLVVDEQGRADVRAKGFLARSWFYNLLHLYVDTEMWGHSLVEFEREAGGKLFSAWHLIPRDYVSPERGEVCLDGDTTRRGIPFRGAGRPVEFGLLLEMGTPQGLGVYEVLCPPVIRKEYAEGDWGKDSEKYGSPLLSILTDTGNKEELDARELMAKNFASSGYVIGDVNDKIEFLERKSSDGHSIYLERIRLSDEKISKIINGQTGTSDQNAYVGSSEVHERILDKFTADRLRGFEFWANETLFPFLVEQGYVGLRRRYFWFEALHADALAPKKEEKKEDVLGKKKALMWGGRALDACCGPIAGRVVLNLEGIFERAVKDVFDRRVASGDLEAESLRATVKKLWAGLDEGMGKPYLETRYLERDWELGRALRHNVLVFSAFKNHAQVGDLVAAMVDPATGELRDWEAFRDVANGIVGHYNQLWLDAEYSTAYSAAQMGVKWKDFEDGRDVLPYLRFTAVRDARVRAGHKALHGVVRHIDDAFWDSYCPPLAWNCRCDLEPVAGGETLVLPKNLPTEKEAPKEFRVNPGKSGQVFGVEHAYFAGLEVDVRDRILQQMSGLVFERELGYLREVARFRASMDEVGGREDLGAVYSYLTAEGLGALHRYSDRDYLKLNRYVRGDVAGNGYVEHLAVFLEHTLSLLPDAAGVSFRGTSMPMDVLEIWRGASVSGNRVVESGFFSTDLEMGNTDFFKVYLSKPGWAGVVFRVLGKRGKNISAVSQYGPTFGGVQREILFNRGTSFRVLDFYFDSETSTYTITITDE